MRSSARWSRLWCGEGPTGTMRMKIVAVAALGAVLLAGAIAGGAVGARGDTPPDTTTTATTADTTATDTSTTETTSTETTPATTTEPTTTTVPTPAMPPINYGVADDTGKYAEDGGAWFDTMLKGANLTEERWTLAFDPRNPTVIDELPF